MTEQNPGDLFNSHKNLGIGIVTSAKKVDMDTENAFEMAVESMTLLNKYACEAMEGMAVHSCTDITGFGFLGHLKEMMEASGLLRLSIKTRCRIFPLLTNMPENLSSHVRLRKTGGMLGLCGIR